MYWENKKTLESKALFSGRKLLCLLIVLFSFISFAQKTNPEDSLQQPIVKILKKLDLSGTIRMRYTASTKSDIDVNGKQHTSPDDYSSNAFTLPQVRLVVSGNITDDLDVYFRANFADFFQNPQNKVLEYAYATYHLTDFLSARAGLFRPEFGREDDIATDFLQSFDYTNQYSAFAENGWMNYQMGVSLLGARKFLGIPLTYAVGIFNGNGREGFTDNDNGKQIPMRLTAKIIPSLDIGLSGGLGKNKGNSVYAWGADFNFEKNIGNHFEFAVLGEYKEGSNQSLFFKNEIPDQQLADYKVRGLYVLPSFQYKIHKKFLKGFEASFKYEYLDPNYLLGGNILRQFVPMIGADLAEKYAIRFQIGMVVDRYSNNVVNSTQYNSSRFLTQLQLRF